MGFLERMVGDLVRDATGINTRKIRRMVGGKGLLALGAGAAIAGGLGAFGKGQGQNQGPSTWGNPNAPAPPVAPPTPSQAPSAAQHVAPAVPGNTAPPLPGNAAPPVPGHAPPPPTPTAAAPPPPIPGASAGPPASVPSPPAPQIEAETSVEEEAEVSPELTYAIVRTMVGAALADGNLSASEKSLIQNHLGDSGLGAEQVQQVQRDLVLPPTPAELAAMTSTAEDRQAMYRFGAFVLLADGNVDDLERSWLDRVAEAFGFTPDQKAALEAEIFA